MVRIPLTPAQRAVGLALGAELRAARAGRPMTIVADAAGISVETLRKIETGRIPTPSFATVAAVAAAVDLSLDELAGRLAGPPASGHRTDLASA
jgi:transcriptional regulator with XRE-family HTH domain